jgi:hypothetical protein
MKPKRTKASFEFDLIKLPLTRILPSRQVTEITKNSVKYRCIARSIDEVGIIEPLVVYRKPDRQGRYLLLDGHLKREILLDKGQTETECLPAHDDEAYTYNKRISRLAVVQEQYMITRAISRGVPEERIARALDVNIEFIRQRRKLLNGISGESIKLLGNRAINPVTFNVIRRMKPARQAEACQLMRSASNFSSSYAKSLLAATKDADLVRPRRPKYPRVVTSADLALMERELKNVQQDFKAVEVTYGEDTLHLAIAAGYVSKLTGNQKVVRYLEDNHPEILNGFRRIVSVTYV